MTIHIEATLALFYVWQRHQHISHSQTVVERRATDGSSREVKTQQCVSGSVEGSTPRLLSTDTQMQYGLSAFFLELLRLCLETSLPTMVAQIERYSHQEQLMGLYSCGLLVRHHNSHHREPAQEEALAGVEERTPSPPDRISRRRLSQTRQPRDHSNTRLSTA